MLYKFQNIQIAVTLLALCTLMGTSVTWAQEVARYRQSRPDKQIDVRSPLPKGKKAVHYLKFSPDSSQLAAGDTMGNLFLLDVQSGKRVCEFQPNPNFDPNDAHDLNGLKVEDIFFAENQMLVGWENGAIGSFNPVDEKLVLEKRIREPSEGLARIAFSPDGTLIGIATFVPNRNRKSKIAVELFDHEKKKTLATFRFRGDSIQLAFSPDGNELAYACNDRIRFMTKEGRKSRAVLNVRDNVAAIKYSNDGRTLLVGLSSFEGTEASPIYRYDVSKKEVPAPDKIQLENVIGAADWFRYSPDGSQVIIGVAFDYTVCDGLSLKQEGVVLAKDRAITDAAAYSPNGQWLALAGDSDLVDLLSQKEADEKAAKPTGPTDSIVK